MNRVSGGDPYNRSHPLLSTRMTIRLAIFDFDGTLADSFPFFMSVFNELADQHGFRRVDAQQAERLRHYGPRDIMRHVGMPAWKLPLASRSFIERMTSCNSQLLVRFPSPDFSAAVSKKAIIAGP